MVHRSLHEHHRALLLTSLYGRLRCLFLPGDVGLPGFQFRSFLADTTRTSHDRKQYTKTNSAHGQQLVCASRSTSMQCGTAAATKPKHSTAPLGLPGRQMTSDLSTTAARLRDKIALWVIFMDSIRIASPKPGRSPVAQSSSGRAGT